MAPCPGRCQGSVPGVDGAADDARRPPHALLKGTDVHVSKRDGVVVSLQHEGVRRGLHQFGVVAAGGGVELVFALDESVV